jgi:xanthine dehydrogenase accessory factor
MGWQVVVVGRKPAGALAARFPEADDHIFLMHPESVMERVIPDRRTAAVVMNHTYVRDRELMGSLLESHIPYVGMLGPSERTGRMIEELTGQGPALTNDKRARLFGPVGLDIGTETPEEIALAAIAEIQAVLHGRSGLNLRNRTGPIHSGRA